MPLLILTPVLVGSDVSPIDPLLPSLENVCLSKGIHPICMLAIPSIEGGLWLHLLSNLGSLSN